SCEKSSLPEAESTIQEFYASVPQDENLQRVSLSGASVLWSNDDAISLYDGKDTSSGAIFTTTLESDSKTAVFKGSGAQTLGGLYYAFYPAASDCFTSWNKGGDGKLRYKIPAIQYARAGNLPENCCPMLGSGNGSTLSFQHLVGYLSFEIGAASPDNIVKVVVSSDASVLSGDYIWALGTSTKPSLGDGAATTSLQNRDSSPLGVGRYFVAVRPRVMKTLNLTFVTKDGKEATVSASNVDTNLGKVQYLGIVRNLNYKTVSVGDIYVENGEKTGIVVAVGSTDYTVMTLTGVSKSWASKDITSVSGLAANRDNGSINTATMATWDDFETNFPAAYYCHNYGGKPSGWYLPGSSEMKTLMANMGFGSADTYAAFDKKIKDAGGTTLGANNTIARFWCSDTDNKGEKAYYVYYKEPNGISAYTGVFTAERNTRCLKRISLE
ncbi:MAG: hypothetical protein PUB45_02050, partial [Bacteroidales bacterium]|nr:hypothetical protein [Bacteroidales bacterium]